MSLPLQMMERLRRAQPDSVANHVNARQSLIGRSVSFAEAWLFSSSAAPVIYTYTAMSDGQ